MEIVLKYHYNEEGGWDFSNFVLGDFGDFSVF